MPALIFQDVFRPCVTPPSGMPFGVRSAGHYRIKPPFTSSKRIIFFVQFFWCVRGSGIIDFDGRQRVLKQHQVALYYPNMRHYWYTDRQCWEFYWFTMDGPLVVSQSAAFGLEAGIYDAGPAPTAMFRTLLRLVKQPSRQAELQACVTAFTILAKAAGSHADHTDGLVDMAVERMHQQYHSPTLNVKTLATALGVQGSVFYTRFHAAIGIPPSVYLARLRMQNAMSLLQNTNLSVALIAAQCGYADADYFSRAVRRITGHPPLQFRKLYQGSDLRRRETVNRHSV